MAYIKNAIKNTYTLLVLTIVSAAIGYLLRIYLSRNLSVEDYGLFYSIITFSIFFLLFQGFGTNSALTKFIPELVVKNKKLEIRSFVIMAFLIQLIILVVFTLLVFIYSKDISVFFFKTEAAADILNIIMLSLLFTSFYSIFYATFQGFQKIRMCSLMDPVKITTIFVLSIALIGMGALGVAYAYLAGWVLVAVVFFVPFASLLGGFRIKISTSAAKKLLLFGIPVFIGSFANFIVGYADTLMLAAFTNLREVGFYQAALPTSQLLWHFSIALSVVAFPLFAELRAKNKNRDLDTSATFFTNAPFFILIPAAIVLFTFPEIIISRLFGHDYISASVQLRILVIGAVFYTPFYLFQNLLISLGKPLLNTKIIISTAIFSFALNVMLIPLYGATGAAITSSISFIFGTVVSYFFVRRTVNVKIFYKKLTKIVAAAAATVLLILFIKDSIFMRNEVLEAVLDLGAGFIFYTFLIIKTKVATREDMEFLRKSGIKMPRWFGL